MPTGYTADVGDGKVTEFADYALNCARAFGALVMLRDSDQSLEATKRFIEDETYIETTSYYAKRRDELQADLFKLMQMTNSEALVESRLERDKVIDRNIAAKEKAKELYVRYEAMLSQVEDWEPPTEEHVKFKEFMIEQLRQSIDFDCKIWEEPLPEVSVAWRDKMIEITKEALDNNARHIAEEQERNAQRKGWIVALVESL